MTETPTKRARLYYQDAVKSVAFETAKLFIDAPRAEIVDIFSIPDLGVVVTLDFDATVRGEEQVLTKRILVRTSGVCEVLT